MGITVPVLKEDARFRVDNLALDLRLGAGKLYFAQRQVRSRVVDIIEIDVAARKARAIGHVPEQMLRYPMSVANGLAFVSVLPSSDLWVRKPNGAHRQR